VRWEKELSTTVEQKETLEERKQRVEETNHEIDTMIENIQNCFEESTKLHKEACKSLDEKISLFENAIPKERNKDKRNLLILAKRHFGFEKQSAIMFQELVADVTNLREVLLTNAKILNIVSDIIPDVSEGYVAKNLMDSALKQYGESWEGMRKVWELKKTQLNQESSQSNNRVDKKGEPIYG
jgi:hypothetical protein